MSVFLLVNCFCFCVLVVMFVNARVVGPVVVTEKPVMTTIAAIATTGAPAAASPPPTTSPIYGLGFKTQYIMFEHVVSNLQNCLVGQQPPRRPDHACQLTGPTIFDCLRVS